MSAPAALRAVVLALLVALLVLPAPDATSRGEPAQLAGRDLRPLLAAALDPSPRAAVRAESSPPAATELALLEEVGARGPLVAALPDSAPAVRVLATPARARAGRWGAIAFAVRGEPGDRVLATLAAGASVVDSVRVEIGPSGETAAAFRVRPARAGWHDWAVGARGVTASAGAWVAPARAPRLLLASGAPGWETRFAARALEEAGVTVATSQFLGRGLRVGVPFPESREALRAYDVVVLAPGAPVTPARLALLERYVAEDGGGVLVAGVPAAVSPLRIAARARAAPSLRGEALRWALPPEIIALPPSAIASEGERLEGIRPGAQVGATTGAEGALAAFRAHGRGRVAAVGVLESWRWRMEAGRVAEHRDHWSSLVHWLAGGLREPVTVRLPAAEGAVGSPLELTLHGRGAGAADLRLTRPGGAAEPLALAPHPIEAGAERATFIPVDSGVHLLSSGDSVVAAYHAVLAPGPGPGAAGELSLLAARSGGAALPRDSIGPWLARWRAAAGGSRNSEGSKLALVGLAALAATVEWVLRRSRGLR